MAVLQSNRVLIPVDIANLTSEALDMARSQVISTEGTHVLAVFAANEQTSAANWGTIDGESREDYCLRDVQHRLAGTVYENAQVHVAFGDPAEQISKVARDIRADLVILPCNKKGRLARLMGGSVAEKVLRNLPCPMLVLPLDCSE